MNQLITRALVYWKVSAGNFEMANNRFCLNGWLIYNFDPDNVHLPSTCLSSVHLLPTARGGSIGNERSYEGTLLVVSFPVISLWVHTILRDLQAEENMTMPYDPQVEISSFQLGSPEKSFWIHSSCFLKRTLRKVLQESTENRSEKVSSNSGPSFFNLEKLLENREFRKMCRYHG